ncbi:MAG: carboxypeptidase regulatory-like domain-containing protein [Chitinispirillaceae bacterium]|nr:carboxypeptidase regulatory-like domain-containing protein [Chitinispirillaceae bacterium]
MKVRNWLGIVIMAAAGLHTAAAQQNTDYLIVKMPVGTVTPDSVIWVQWIGSSRDPLMPTYLAPDSGYIYYSRSPGGGKLGNYRYRVDRPWIDSSEGRLIIHDNEYTHPTITEPVAKRATAFRPGEQTDMGAGVFYCVVALPLATDTLVSNEFQIFVESPLVVERIGPVGTITELTPTFQWKANPGVPYYHVVLSDEAIAFNDSTGEINLEGLSIVWQAITPNDGIVYGSPDPSKTITADPPPLSPGVRYTWIVLNNYGNHMAFSSYRSAQLPPGEFTVAGTPLERPENVYPTGGIELNNRDNDTFSFSWTNLDPKANTYKIYVYVGSDFSGVLEGVDVRMAVWQSEVRAADVDTMTVSINASSILTSNKYIWRVMAIDEQGAGTAGDTSSFRYSAPTGTMGIYTREYAVQAREGSLDTVVNVVGLVQASVEVLDGSMEAPLAFYTDFSGNLLRTRPTGTYRVTTIKEGFENQTRTIVLSESDTTRDTFYLQRPESQVFGRVVDESNKGINLASVTAVSDRGDTVIAKTDGLGNFVVNCYAADWHVGFEMDGYKSVLPRKITVEAGESYDFKTVTMEKNPYTLSGVVKNSSNQPLLGVRVRLLRDGTVLGEIPSTPQSGAFSFTVAAGTYTLSADRTGFTSYTGTVEMTSSKSVTITMQPRATFVSGYVYGRSYVGGRDVIAPIPAARIAFVKVGTADTAWGKFDAVYGNYSISLAGGVRFAVYSSADGYAPQSGADTISTGATSNITFHDTLQAYAMLPGAVRMSASGAAVGDVAISLVNLITRSVVASAKSAANGYFELRTIPDGSFGVMAGKDGLVLDSIQGADTLTVSSGRPGRSALNLFMKAGDKTIKWSAQGPDGLTGKIKIQSPIIKTINFTDTLAKAGPGAYIIEADANQDTIVDLSYHRFVVPDTVPLHIDTISLNVFHRRQDTMRLDNETITLEIRSADSLDSARIFYKDATASAWLSAASVAGSALSYDFAIKPPKDGSVLQYYFKAYRRYDVYGYEKETYYAYIAPDTSRLTKIEIVPYASDTLRFPAECSIQFFFKGYYSSSFIRATNLDSQAVSWSLTNAGGCVLQNNRGLRATVITSLSALSEPATLTVTVDENRLPVKSGVSASLSVRFTVSGSPLSRIVVKRVDAKSPQPISTSLADRAEFVAEGIDRDNNVLTLSPAWSITPSGAGSISSDGTFRPRRNFVGYVRVFATAGDVQGEYVAAPSGTQTVAIPGLNVRYLISRKSTPDTASNGSGMSIIFPPNVVTGNDLGTIELGLPDMSNRLKRGFLNVRMADSNAYSIDELEDVSFNLSSDSIRLILAIPASFQQDAASQKRIFRIAQWNEDSLRWDPLVNSSMAADGKTIMAGITHFSTYAVVYQPGKLSAEISISPNPFSPRVRPGIGRPLGTCISVKPEMPEGSLQDLQVRIYNLLGEMVWGVQIQGALPEQYSIWWDGTTTERIEPWKDFKREVEIKGKRLCRNGRYFVAVIIKDMNNKEKKYLKQIVLMK